MSAPNLETPTLPQRPAGKAYFPVDFQQEAEESINVANTFYQRYAEQLQDKRYDDGVHEYFIPRAPDAPLSQLPLMAGRAHIDGLTPLDVFTAIRVTRLRMIWDPRIQAAVVVRAYTLHDFAFYLVWRGIGPIYSPRDVVGLQSVRAYDAAGRLQAYPDFTTRKLVVAYVSVPSLPGIPEAVEGCVRAQILEGGYIIEANETGCNITYFAKVDLNLIIPSWIACHLVGETRRCETRRCVTRLRDALKTFGVPPLLIDKHQCIALHVLEYFPDSRSITLFATVVRPGTFSVYLDYEKMYTQGIVATNIEGDAAAFIRIRDEVAADDGMQRRRLAIDVLAEGVGGDFRITMDARDKDGPDSGTGPGWW